MTVISSNLDKIKEQFTHRNIYRTWLPQEGKYETYTLEESKTGEETIYYEVGDETPISGYGEPEQFTGYFDSQGHPIFERDIIRNPSNVPNKFAQEYMVIWYGDRYLLVEGYQQSILSPSEIPISSSSIRHLMVSIVGQDHDFIPDLPKLPIQSPLVKSNAWQKDIEDRLKAIEERLDQI